MDFQPSEAQKALVASVRALAQRELVGVGVADGVPREILQKLAGSGMAGIAMPVSDGGQGGLLLDAVLALEAMTELSPVGGDCLAALNFGAIQQLAHHGSDDIKERFLAPCLAGSRLAAVAMTEPEAGSAVTDLRARARLEDRGQAPISPRIGVVVPELEQRRREVVRIFSRAMQPGRSLPGARGDAGSAPMPFNAPA